MLVSIAEILNVLLPLLGAGALLASTALVAARERRRRIVEFRRWLDEVEVASIAAGPPLVEARASSTMPLHGAADRLRPVAGRRDRVEGDAVVPSVQWRLPGRRPRRSRGVR
ncbi:MAG: hypothetical protein FJ257_00010 [Phycisphaerae bacterium]|nr:hypothetical protein [Phycisphaerae bacterium]